MIWIPHFTTLGSLIIRKKLLWLCPHVNKWEVSQGTWKLRGGGTLVHNSNLRGVPQPSLTRPPTQLRDEPPSRATSARPGRETSFEAPNTRPGPHLSEERGEAAFSWRGGAGRDGTGTGLGSHAPHARTPQRCRLPQDGRHGRASGGCSSPCCHWLAQHTWSRAPALCYADWPMPWGRLTRQRDEEPANTFPRGVPQDGGQRAAADLVRTFPLLPRPPQGASDKREAGRWPLLRAAPLGGEHAAQPGCARRGRGGPGFPRPPGSAPSLEEGGAARRHFFAVPSAGAGRGGECGFSEVGLVCVCARRNEKQLRSTARDVQMGQWRCSCF